MPLKSISSPLRKWKSKRVLIKSQTQPSFSMGKKPNEMIFSVNVGLYVSIPKDILLVNLHACISRILASKARFTSKASPGIQSQSSSVSVSLYHRLIPRKRELFKEGQLHLLRGVFLIHKLSSAVERPQRVEVVSGLELWKITFKNF